MMFVTVGMHYQGFDRLIQKMDEIAGRIDEKVIMQIGSAQYEPENAEYFRFSSGGEIEEFCRDARVVICHDGAGSIIMGLKCGKPLVAVPRMKKYGEVPYDTQHDLATELAKAGVITVVWDVGQLESALRDMDTGPRRLDQGEKLVPKLKEYVNQLSRESK